jgi:PII-like signaling protein
MLPEQGQLLRIFLGESDKHEGRPLHEWLVRAAKDQGLAGATVLRGLEGYGAHGRMHSARVLGLSSELPLVVEIVDTEENITQFLPVVDSVIQEGLATVESVQIRLYRGGENSAC